MRFISMCCVAAVISLCTVDAEAQRMQQKEKQFLKESPLIGEPLPDVTVYSLDGEPFTTANLRGHYTVLTFGCLT